jgi:hypothetical protein
VFSSTMECLLVSFFTIFQIVLTLSSQPNIKRWESCSEMTVVWIFTDNGQNKDNKKGIRSTILRKETHGMTQNKMVQPSTRRY